jgi:ABC-type molybdate transport system substrate-binding protein
VDAERNAWITRRDALASLAATPAASWAAQHDPSLVVFAAASLREAMDRAGYIFVARRLSPVKFSYGASSALARQIEQGAPADIFVSADTDWMDYLAKRHLIVEATRRDLFSNHPADIAPTKSTVSFGVDRGRQGSHSIVYPGAVVSASKNPIARAFLANLKSGPEANVFRKFGFRVLE